jgi:hypothetical protein
MCCMACLACTAWLSHIVDIHTAGAAPNSCITQIDQAPCLCCRQMGRRCRCIIQPQTQHRTSCAPTTTSSLKHGGNLLRNADGQGALPVSFPSCHNIRSQCKSGTTQSSRLVCGTQLASPGCAGLLALPKLPALAASIPNALRRVHHNNRSKPLARYAIHSCPADLLPLAVPPTLAPLKPRGISWS